MGKRSKKKAQSAYEEAEAELEATVDASKPTLQALCAAYLKVGDALPLGRYQRSMQLSLVEDGTIFDVKIDQSRSRLI